MFIGQLFVDVGEKAGDVFGGKERTADDEGDGTVGKDEGVIEEAPRHRTVGRIGTSVDENAADYVGDIADGYRDDGTEKKTQNTFVLGSGTEKNAGKSHGSESYGVVQ